MTLSTQHHIERTDGSTLSIWTIGSEDGTPVVLCHPAPGSGRFDPDPITTAEAGIRIIAPNRQGYGGSDRTAISTIEQAGRDVLSALDELDVPSAAIAGWSAGGRVAMWLATHHPERVRSLAVVATPAPHQAVPWIPDEQVAMIDGMRSDPAAAIDQMAAMFAPMIADSSLRTTLIAPGPADTRTLETDSDLSARVDTMLDEAFLKGAAGMATDIASYTMADWGFEPSNITVPTVVYSASDDVAVPPAHGQWYADHIPAAHHVVESRWGHLVITKVWRTIVENRNG
jgi:pimeloyl-ACP methyl ester carboxylesterase